MQITCVYSICDCNSNHAAEITAGERPPHQAAACYSCALDNLRLLILLHKSRYLIMSCASCHSMNHCPGLGLAGDYIFIHEKHLSCRSWICLWDREIESLKTNPWCTRTKLPSKQMPSTGWQEESCHALGWLTSCNRPTTPSEQANADSCAPQTAGSHLASRLVS